MEASRVVVRKDSRMRQERRGKGKGKEEEKRLGRGLARRSQRVLVGGRVEMGH